MRRLVVSEWEHIPRETLGHRACAQLQRMDERHAGRTGATVFDWTAMHYVRCQNWVGVIHIPGLILEIVPKVTGADDDVSTRETAQRNLLYMLAYTRKIPVRHRSIAPLLAQQLPMLEAIARLFAEGLLEQLRLGCEHAYRTVRENRSTVRGKLVLTEHLKRNAAFRHRVFVEYDEYQADTWLNRCLKAACRALLGFTRRNWTQRCLREALVYLDEVGDVEFQRHHFDKIRLDRRNERFHELFDLARMILENATPGPVRGQKSSFSLLFPMETVFEEFIAQFVRRHAAEFGLSPNQVAIQAVGQRRYLLRDERGHRRKSLQPDIVILDREGTPKVVLDTKWKDLTSSGGAASEPDLYQLYVYCSRYECRENVLLFPKMELSERRCFHVLGTEDSKIRLEFVDVTRDLRANRATLLGELRGILSGAVTALDDG